MYARYQAKKNLTKRVDELLLKTIPRGPYFRRSPYAMDINGDPRPVNTFRKEEPYVIPSPRREEPPSPHHSPPRSTRISPYYSPRASPPESPRATMSPTVESYMPTGEHTPTVGNKERNLEMGEDDLARLESESIRDKIIEEERAEKEKLAKEKESIEAEKKKIEKELGRKIRKVRRVAEQRNILDNTFEEAYIDAPGQFRAFDRRTGKTYYLGSNWRKINTKLEKAFGTTVDVKNYAAGGLKFYSPSATDPNDFVIFKPDYVDRKEIRTIIEDTLVNLGKINKRGQKRKVAASTLKAIQEEKEPTELEEKKIPIEPKKKKIPTEEVPVKSEEDLIEQGVNDTIGRIKKVSLNEVDQIKQSLASGNINKGSEEYYKALATLHKYSADNPIAATVDNGDNIVIMGQGATIDSPKVAEAIKDAYMKDIGTNEYKALGVAAYSAGKLKGIPNKNNKADNIALYDALSSGALNKALSMQDVAFKTIEQIRDAVAEDLQESGETEVLGPSGNIVLTLRDLRDPDNEFSLVYSSIPKELIPRGTLRDDVNKVIQTMGDKK